MSAAPESLLPPEARLARSALPPRGRNELRRTAEVLLPALLILGLQVGGLTALLQNRIDLPAFAAIHAGSALIAAAWAYAFRRGGSVNRFAVLLAVAAMALGPIGTLGLILIVPLQALLRRRATPFEEWYRALFPDEEPDDNRRLFELISSGRAETAGNVSVESFTDVMRAGSIEQKRAVITLLVRRFRPEFAPALNLALQDPNPAIRVQAATAAAEIESDFLERAIALEADAKAHPADALRRLALAQHYDAYAFSGLLDRQREHDNRAEALQHYRAVLALQPGHLGARAAVSRILVRTGRYAEAVDWLGERLDSGHVNRATVAWYAECLFHLRRYGDLRGVALRFRDLLLGSGETTHDDGLSDAIRLWLAADPAKGKPQ